MITFGEKAGRWAFNAAAETPKPPIVGLKRIRATWLKQDLGLKVPHLRGASCGRDGVGLGRVTRVSGRMEALGLITTFLPLARPPALN